MLNATLDRIHDWLDSVVVHVIGFWLLFIRLPSLHLSTHHDNGHITHPSHGPVGTCYQTQCGQHYARTGRGVRKVGTQLGKMLIARTKKIRRDAIGLRVLLVALLILAATIIALIASAN